MMRKGFGGGGGWRGGKGGGGGGGNKGQFPKALRNRATYGRRRRHSAPTPSTRFVYGPPRDRRQRQREFRMLRWRCPELVQDLEKRDQERDEEREETRVPPAELKKLPELLVEKINFHMLGRQGDGAHRKICGNAKAHHTDLYTCNQVKGGQPVLRRGQEFKATIVFNRPYNKAQDDLILVVSADEDSPGKDLLVEFKLDEERTREFTGQHWAARIVRTRVANPNGLKLAVYIPPDCMVGEWELSVKTSLRGKLSSYEYAHPTPFLVLFNPWCKEDSVYYDGDQNHLDEYVLNDVGTVYQGASNNVRSRPWTYGQFDDNIVQISVAILKQAFNFKVTPAMNDPIKVSRALSKIINSSGDDGVLEGNWSGDYEGGENPTHWSSSAKILTLFDETGKPVKYGQCWVFAHVMTAVCRALGLPCRSVTNFASAHDTDNSCTIDRYYDEKGALVKYKSSDSIWNFHVWDEVWIQRPDIEEYDCNGWHVVDATPQERSDGVYQCGPCPVKAVKNGLIYLGYDTDFVFGEVNADVVHWTQNKKGVFVPSALKKKLVGARISTKFPDGKPFAGSLNWFNMDEPGLRMDLTNEYKHEEGSEEERLAVRRAVRNTYRGSDLYQRSAAIDVNLECVGEAKAGEDLNVTAVVENCTDQPKAVDMIMKAGTSSYWDDPDSAKEICEEMFGTRTIPAKTKEKIQITIPSAKYIEVCNDNMTVCVHFEAIDVEKDMPYSDDKPFQLSTPVLDVTGPKVAKPGEVVTLTATFTNPLSLRLTKCQLFMEGGMKPASTDRNNFEPMFSAFAAQYRDINPKEKVTLTVKLYWEEKKKDQDDDEETDDEEEEEEEPPPAEKKEKTVTQKLEFYCDQLASLPGTHTIVLKMP